MIIEKGEVVQPSSVHLGDDLDKVISEVNLHGLAGLNES
jgi:hypothetical protein